MGKIIRELVVICRARGFRVVLVDSGELLNCCCLVGDEEDSVALVALIDEIAEGLAGV